MQKSKSKRLELDHFSLTEQRTRTVPSPPPINATPGLRNIYTIGCKLFARFRRGGVNYLDSLLDDVRLTESLWDAPLSVFGWLLFARSARERNLARGWRWSQRDSVETSISLVGVTMKTRTRDSDWPYADVSDESRMLWPMASRTAFASSRLQHLLRRRGIMGKWIA